MTPGSPPASGFLQFMEAAPDAMVCVDKAGRIVLANSQAEALFGYPRSALVGRAIETLIPADARTRHVRHRDQFAADPHVRAMGAGLDLSAQRRDGTQFPVEISLSPIQTDEGPLVMAAVRDITARRAMEAELRTSRDLLARAEASAGYGSFEIDVATRAIRVSDGFKAAFGLAPEATLRLEELTGMVVPEDLPAAQAVTQRALEAVGTVYSTYRLRRADGQVRSFDVTMMTTADAEGRPERVLGIARDLTERERSQASFERVANMLDESEKATARGSWEWDLAQDKAFWSRGMYRIFGVDPATFDNDDEAFLALVHPDDRQGVRDAITRALRDGGPFFQEYRLRRGDGQWRNFRGQGSVGPPLPGGRRVMYGIVEDVTDRLRADTKFRGLLEAAPDAMVMVDATGTIVLVNQQAERLFGYPRAELLGAKVERLIPQRFQSRHLGHREGYFHDPKLRPMGAGLELFGVRRDGTEFPVEISLSPLDTEAGPWVSAAIRDITQRKQAEAEVERSRRQAMEIQHLQEQSDFRARFINSAAHELRTPLLPLRAQMFWLQGRLANAAPEDRQATLVMRRNLDRLGVLVEDLLEASRLQSGRLDIHVAPGDVHRVVQETVASYEEAARQRGLRLESSCQGDGTALLDAKRIQQVVYNLVGNAMKFTPRGGLVQVASRGDGDTVTVVVSDSGIGIEPKALDRLFKPFVQVHDTMQVSDPGSGLGLYLTRAIVEMHGGDIRVESEGLQRGTRVTVRLPRRPRDGSSPAGSSGTSTPGPAGPPARPSSG